MKYLIYVFMIAGLLACKNDNTPEEIVDDVEQKIDTIQSDMDKELKELESQLWVINNKLTSRIHDINADIENSADDARVELEETRNELVEAQARVKTMLDSTSAEVSEDWKIFKSETEEYIKELTEKINK